MTRVGIDLGSTTIKIIVLDDDYNIIYKTYRRHFSRIKENLYQELTTLLENKIIDDESMIAVSGSAGMGIGDLYEIQ